MTLGEPKQHHVVDVLVGALAAFVGYLLFLRSYPREAIAEGDRVRAPLGALWAVVIFVIMVAGFFVVYRSGMVEF